MKINVNQYLHIKYHNNLYHLIEKTSGLVLDVTFDLEQMAENIIKYDMCYLTDTKVISLEELISSIRDLKTSLIKEKL